MGEHKEKLEWLGNAANHRGDDGGSKDDPEAGAALGFCGGVERSCDGRKAKELDPAGGCKTGASSLRGRVLWERMGSKLLHVA